MRPLSVLAIGALSLVSSVAHANSIAFAPTGSTTIHVGETTTFNVVVTLTQGDLISALFHVDVTAAIGIIQANNTAAAMGGSTSGFALRTMAFIQVGTCTAAPGNPTCFAPAPGAPSAGRAGGNAAVVLNAGTYTLGSYTVVGNSLGGATVSARINPGFEWLDSNYNTVPNPTFVPLGINVVPEPTTVALLGLGLIGLALRARERASRR